MRQATGNASDVLIVGGGLQGCLLALAIAAKRPAWRTTLVEQSAELGGNHTWCLHEGDVPAAVWTWLRPLVAHHWPDLAVRFAGHERVLAQPYHAITAARLRQVMQSLGASSGNLQCLLGTPVEALSAEGITLPDGSRLLAPTVVDARGLAAGRWLADSGYQKFVGLEVLLEQPSGVARPLIMDADVPQDDGMHFVYVLPFAPKQLLIEDTVFSPNASLDAEAHVAKVMDYAAQQGWRVAQVLRQESGVLPMPWRARSLPAETAMLGQVLQAGMAGGWFHPATGYSLASAAQLAHCFAEAETPQAGVLACQALAKRQRSQRRFARQLNWALFRACQPRHRRRMFERFYAMPLPLIEAFHAFQLEPHQRWQLLGHCYPGWRAFLPEPG